MPAHASPVLAPEAFRRLPFDYGSSRIAVTYLRRLLVISVCAAATLLTAGVYLGYRAISSPLSGWMQVLIPLVGGSAAYLIYRWRTYREIPTALDQVVALVLLVILLPTVLLTRFNASLFPSQYRRTEMVGRRGRTVVAIEPIGIDGPKRNLVKPNLWTVVSLLPAMVMGRVRFRGRPMLRVDRFCRVGPVPITEFGRAPGLFPAYIKSTDAVSDERAANLASIWKEINVHGKDPGPDSVVVLAHLSAPRRVIVEEEGRSVLYFVPAARVLLPFAVAPEDEAFIRDTLRDTFQVEDVIVGRGDRLGAVLAAAWKAWGADDGPSFVPGYPADPTTPKLPKRDRKEPSAWRSAHRKG